MKQRLDGWMSGQRLLVALVAAGLLAATACDPGIEEDPEPGDQVQAIFDPDTGIIPLPSNLALNDQGTLPESAFDNLEEPTAEGEFERWVQSLHGWLPAAEITIPFSGPLDESTVVADHVALYHLTDAGAEEIEVADVVYMETETGSVVQIVPATALSNAQNYAAVATNGIQSADGEPVVASQAIFFAASEGPLYDAETGEVLVGVLEGQVDAEGNPVAATLEQLRQFYMPAFAAVDADADIERDDVVAATVWTTVTDTFLEFDPDTGQIPFPHLAALGQLPAEQAPEGSLQRALLSALNERDGFGINAANWVPVDGPVDPESITTETVVLGWVPEDEDGLGPAPIRYTQADENYYDPIWAPEMEHILIPLNLPLRQDRTNSGIVLGCPPGTEPIYEGEDKCETPAAVDPNGFALKPAPTFVFLRSQYPLARCFDADGNEITGTDACAKDEVDPDRTESLVSVIPDEDALAAELGRIEIKDLFSLLPVFLGIDRYQIAGAWPFITDEVTRPLQEVRATVAAVLAQAGGAVVTGDDTDVSADPSTNVAFAHTDAEFLTVDLVDDQGQLQTPATENVPVAVYVPAEAGDCAPPYDVAIIQHGLGGNAADMAAAFADDLAASPYCLATVYVDFPFHGERAVGATSGEGFLTADLGATANHFVQANADLFALTQTIAADGLEALIDADGATDFLDETSIGYAGMSLGGFVGTEFVTVEPLVNVAAFNAPAGKLSRLLTSIAPQLAGLLPGEEGSFERFQALAFIQWLADPIDPLSFAPHTVLRPLDVLALNAQGEFVDSGEDVPSAEVLVQMVDQDQTVPNELTLMYVEAMGVDLSETTFTGVGHSFVREDSAAGLCGRQQIAAWLSSGLGGAQAEIPADLVASTCQGQ